MAMKAIAIGNLLMIQYFLTSHYRVPHKWVWLVVSALVLQGQH
jgi:hypothetical protein